MVDKTGVPDKNHLLPNVSSKLYHIHKIRETDWSIKYGQSRDTDNVGHKTQNKYKEQKKPQGSLFSWIRL
jgi:hypothetical protein